ncbi:MAG TPA: hypothetical protein VMT64_10790 [Candidatus Binataceae bacterium]|nr:hypothetical protein [Candidatus Binataceae bacterium]
MSEQHNSRIERVLDELIEAAQRVGVKVRRERIMREVGYRARGGACRLRDNDLVIIDRDQSPHEQLEIVAEALKGRDLEAVYLSPEARRILMTGPTG